jgi:hypothetical protein
VAVSGIEQILGRFQVPRHQDAGDDPDHAYALRPSGDDALSPFVRLATGQRLALSGARNALAALERYLSLGVETAGKLATLALEYA